MKICVLKYSARQWGIEILKGILIAFVILVAFIVVDWVIGFMQSECLSGAWFGNLDGSARRN